MTHSLRKTEDSKRRLSILVAAIIVTPLIGLASDKFGRRAMFAALSAVLVLTTIPALLLMRERGRAPLADIDADPGDPPRVSKNGQIVSAN